jgi:predicted dienelactone hydrolase
MTRFTHLLATSSLALLALLTPAHADGTGMTEIRIDDPQGGRDTDGFLWYPADPAAPDVLALGNAVWEPIRVSPDADAIPGSYPLVVLSHGMFGNSRNQAWLAEGLVAQGFVVVAIDHPGTSTFQRDPDQRRQLWGRPTDASRAIDTVLSDPRIGPLVDQTRIYAAGHSLGGFTAMLLAGARFDKDRLDGFCATDPDDLVCGIFSAWDIATTPEDRTAMQADLSDPRIRAFAVLDLGGSQSLSDASLAAITRPLLVYGAPRDIEGLNLDTESRHLVAALPPATVTYREPETLSHFDFLGLCTEAALDILKEEEPDDVYVCEEGRAERQAEHDAITADIAEFFTTH